MFTTLPALQRLKHQTAARRTPDPFALSASNKQTNKQSRSPTSGAVGRQWRSRCLIQQVLPRCSIRTCSHRRGTLRCVCLAYRAVRLPTVTRRLRGASASPAWPEEGWSSEGERSHNSRTVGCSLRVRIVSESGFAPSTCPQSAAVCV
jgi:hypothetical protein